MANDYWRQREEAQRLLDMRSDAEREREFSALYKRAFDDVQREIDSFYARYAAAEDISIAEAHKRVSQLDMAAYSRRAKAYVDEKNFTDKANEEMRIYNLTMKVNRLEMLKAKIALELAAKGSAEERHLRATLDEATRKELDRQSGILGDTVKHGADPAQIRRIVEGDFHNAKFSERIWSNNKLLQMAIEKELQTGLIQGRRPDYKRVAQLFNASEYAAKRLLHTETKRVRTEAAKERYQENGIEDFEFMALGPTPCDICSELDGKHFPVKKMVAGENAPPMHPNCRCSTAPWVDENAYNAWLDAKASGEFDGGFKDWSGVRGLADRLLANNLRRSPFYELSPEEIEMVKAEAKSIGVPVELLRFNEGSHTGLLDSIAQILIRGDVFPDLRSSSNRDTMSIRAVLAHEYYGHYKHHPSTIPNGDWRDEFRASYCAALNTPNLSDEERRSLMIDAYDRAAEAGVTVTYNKEAKRVIYGY